jgi:hypothetical protein
MEALVPHRTVRILPALLLLLIVPLLDRFSPPAPAATAAPVAVSLQLVGRQGGTPGGLAFIGNQVVATIGPALLVVDIAGIKPTLVGQVSLPGVTGGVVTDGRYAYVAADYAGLQVVDLRNPADPRVVGSLLNPDGAAAWGVYLDGGRIYLGESTDIGDQVTVIDISQPTAPRALGEYAPVDGLIEGMAVAASRLYVADGDALEIVDMTDPANPVALGSFDTPGEAAIVVVAGARAYVVDIYYDDVEQFYRYQLLLLDVANPAAIQLLGHYDSSDDIWAVAAVGNAVYLGMPDALRVLDVRNPAAPTEAGSYAPLTGPLAVQPDGTRLGVPLGSGGFVVLDAASPAAIRRVADWVEPGAPADVVLAGSRAYLTENSLVSGLRVMDLAIPAQPATRGYRSLPGEAWRTAVAGNVAYVADGLAGLRVLDVTDADRPQPLAQYTAAGDVLGVAVSGRRVYLAARERGLRILDVTDPTTPRDIGGFDLPGEAWGVVAAGDTVFVAEQDIVRSLNVTDPARPQPLGRVDLSAYYGNLTLSGDRLYVPTLDGLERLDVSNPAQLVSDGRFDMLDGAHAVAVSGDLAYVSGPAGLTVVDLLTLTEATAFVTPMLANGVAVSGDLIYLAAYDAGLYVLRASGLAPTPEPTATSGSPGPPTATPTGPTPTVGPGGRHYIYLPIAQKPKP